MVFTLPEAELPQVQDARMKATLNVIVTDSETDKSLATGTLMTPNNAIDTTTGTISLKAQFPNADDHLWPGQFVNAHLEVETLHNALTVPSNAVEHGPDGLYVFAVKPDDTIEQVPVTTGYQSNGVTVVTKGLSRARNRGGDRPVPPRARHEGQNIPGRRPKPGIDGRGRWRQRLAKLMDALRLSPPSRSQLRFVRRPAR